MAQNDKEQVEKIFCLFHRKTDCSCLAPVTDEKILKMRIEHIIKNNNLNNQYEIDLESKAKREAENVDFSARLEELSLDS